MEKGILMPYNETWDLLHHEPEFAYKVVEAICNYRFYGKEPQHLTEEQNEYFAKVLPFFKLIEVTE